jgi:hypothetical protein
MLRFCKKDRTSEAHEIVINHMTEKASEVSGFHDIVLASEDQIFYHILLRYG